MLSTAMTNALVGRIVFEEQVTLNCTTFERLHTDRDNCHRRTSKKQREREREKERDRERKLQSKNKTNCTKNDTNIQI